MTRPKKINHVWQDSEIELLRKIWLYSKKDAQAKVAEMCLRLPYFKRNQITDKLRRMFSDVKIPPLRKNKHAPAKGDAAKCEPINWNASTASAFRESAAMYGARYINGKLYKNGKPTTFTELYNAKKNAER